MTRLRNSSLITLAALISGAAQAATFTVVPHGQVPVAANDRVTIQAAINGASDGDTILLRPGTHYLGDPIVLDNVSLTIRAVGDAGSGTDVNVPQALNGADAFADAHVTLQIVQSPTAADAQGSFFIVRNGGDLTVEGVTFGWPERDCENGLDDNNNNFIDFPEEVGLPANPSSNPPDPGLPRVGLCDLFDIGTPVSEVSLDTSLPIEFDTANNSATNLVTGFRTGARLFQVENGAVLSLSQVVVNGVHGAKGRGGVVSAVGGSEVSIDGSLFTHNKIWPDLVLSSNQPMVSEGEGGVVGAVDSLVAISDTQFMNNAATSGGAIAALNSDVTITGSTFTENKAFTGGAMVFENSSVNLETNKFYLNSQVLNYPVLRFVLLPPPGTWRAGGAIMSRFSLLTVSNNIFVGNEAQYGSSIYLDGALAGADPSLVNNHFLFNRSLELNVGLVPTGTVFAQGTGFEFHNNLAQGNLGGVLGALNWPAGTVPDVQYNDFYDNIAVGAMSTDVYVAELATFPSPTGTNIAADPLLVYDLSESTLSPTSVLFPLWPTAVSPLIDAGDPLRSDPGGSRSDIGAYGGAGSFSQDGDGDGWESIFDCDDTDPSIYPTAPEPCDDIDNDCDGIIDNFETTWYIDRDFDGYGDPDDQEAIVCPSDFPLPTIAGGGIWVNQAGDCDDTTPRTNPGNPEACDNLDNDCDGNIDESIPIREQWPDLDGDGFGNGNPNEVRNLACPPPGFSPLSGDCNDGNASIHPLITIEATLHLPLAEADLEGSEGDRNPVFVADGLDQDCDGFDTCYADFDGDGWGQEAFANGVITYQVDNDLDCSNPSAPTASTLGDCNDADPTSYPAALERPGDGADQNCDRVDSCYEDRDGDGFGSPDSIIVDNDLDCSNDSTGNTVTNSLDCDDRLGTGLESAPGLEEVCDGLDNDCDGDVDEVESPDAQYYFLDEDGDGYGVVAGATKACGLPLGYATESGDCDDAEPRANPGALEVCDGIDNNCANGIDEDDATDAITWYEDLDGDGYGNPTLSQKSCEVPTYGGPWVSAERALDCNDADPTVLAGKDGKCGFGACNMSSASPTGFGTMLASLGLILGVGRRRRRQ